MIAITHGRPAMISDQLASSVVLPSIPDAGDTTENGLQLDAVSLHKLRYHGFFHKSPELYEVIHHAVLAFYSSTSPLRWPIHPDGAGHNSQRSSERPELDLGKALQLDQQLTR
ncbi:fungal specific transcription factor [Colletotrichum graminicola]|nr:fungal specific transcription factor [Colletotrichum graminicola]